MPCRVILTVGGQQTTTSVTDFMCAEEVACGLFAKAFCVQQPPEVYCQVMCEGMVFDVQPNDGHRLELVRIV